MFCWFYSKKILQSGGHSSKNLAGQMCTPIRNLLMGQFFVDHTKCLSYGMPSSAYGRAEPMSDLLNTVMWNPYLVVPDIVFWHFIAFSWFLLSSIKYINNQCSNKPVSSCLYKIDFINGSGCCGPASTSSLASTGLCVAERMRNLVHCTWASLNVDRFYLIVLF